MTSVTISCPECSRQLKLPSRDYLGKKGKCPGCQHRFILEEPAIELELAEPENTPSPDQQPSASAAQNFQRSLKKKRGDHQSAASQPSKTSLENVKAPTENLDGFSIQTDDATTSSLERVKRKRRRKSNMGPVVIGMGTALLVICGGAAWWMNQQQADAQPIDDNNLSEIANAEETTTESDTNGLVKEADGGTAHSPTSGDAIDVSFMPFAPDLILHMNPAELWSEERHDLVFMKSIEPIANWIRDDYLVNVTGFQPQEIKRLTLGINFGPLTAEPDIAMKVELFEAVPASSLQRERLKARMSVDVQGVLENDSWTFRIIDDRNFLVASNTIAEAFAEPAIYGGLPSVDMVSLLDESDHMRPMTVMVDVKKLDAHLEYKFPTDLQPIAISFLSWLGNDVRMLSWSLHLEDDLFMETVLINEATSSPKRLAAQLALQFSKLPQSLQSVLKRTQPRDLAEQKFVGRYPAMIRATLLGTQSSTGPNFVRLVTLLPQKAAANLALGSYYATNLVSATDFSLTTGGQSESQLPTTLTGRLKIKMDAEFNRTPLQEAFASIAEACSVRISINGDALKLAGMTQNMPQTFNLGQSTGQSALAQILKNHPELALVADEPNMSLQVTTRSVAADQKLTLFQP